MKGILLAIPMLAFILTSCHTLDRNMVKTSPTSWATVPIVWEKPVLENGLTTITGSLQASFGQFRFSWKVDSSGRAFVSAAEPTGTAERPFYGNMELYLWFFETDKVLIMRVQKPTLGSDKPAWLVPVSAAGAMDLVGALGTTSALPSASPKPVTVTLWESTGIYWKTEGSGFPSPYATDPSGMESLLFPMQIGRAGSSFVILFKVVDQRIITNEIECLIPAAKVSTDAFLAAYDKSSGK